MHDTSVHWQRARRKTVRNLYDPLRQVDSRRCRQRAGEVARAHVGSRCWRSRVAGGRGAGGGCDRDRPVRYPHYGTRRAGRRSSPSARLDPVRRQVPTPGLSHCQVLRRDRHRILAKTTQPPDVNTCVTTVAAPHAIHKCRIYKDLLAMKNCGRGPAAYPGTHGTTIAKSRCNRARLAILASRHTPSKSSSHNGGRRT